MKTFKEFINENIKDYLKPKPKEELQKYYTYYFYLIDKCIDNLNDYGFDANRDNIFTEPIYYTHLYHMLLDLKPIDNKYLNSVKEDLIKSLKTKIDNENV